MNIKLKTKNEEKLKVQTEDQDKEKKERLERQEKVIQSLDRVIQELKVNIHSLNWQKEQLEQQSLEYEQKTEILKAITERLVQSGKEYDDKITELTKAKREAKENLKKKETDLYRQKFEIKDL